MTPESDANLVEKSLNSDDAAFTELIARYQQKVYAFIISHVRNFADAQDLTQNVFMTAYMRLNSLRKYNSFGPWIRKIAINQCRAHGILQKHTERTQKAYGETTLAESSDQIKQKPTQADLWAALSQLPDEQRIILTMFHLEKQSYQEIANFLEIPSTTVQTRLRYARQALRKEIINFMENEMQSNHLPEAFPKDTVKAARELAESLVQAIPADMMDSFRQNWSDTYRMMFDESLIAFYDSLTPEQRKSIYDDETKLNFTDLTVDQQAHLKQTFHKMWVWYITREVSIPPYYVSELEKCRFFVKGEPGTGKGYMRVGSDETDYITFGV